MAKKEKEQEEIKNEQTESQDCMNQETANNEDVQEEQATEETPEVAAEEEETADSDPLSKAMAEAAEWEKKFYYKSAEFENYRKRTIKEKAELILNGSEKAVTAILPVIDDMERALANAEKTDDAVALKEGMELIYKKFLKILQGMGVKPSTLPTKILTPTIMKLWLWCPAWAMTKRARLLTAWKQVTCLTTR